MAKHAKQPIKLPNEKRKKSSGRGCLQFVLAALLVLTLAVIAVGVYLIQPSFARPAVNAIRPAVEAIGIADANAPAEEDFAQQPSAADMSATSTISDRSIPEEIMKQDEANEPKLVTKLVAQCDGVDIYSPITHENLTGILFHQASYEWAKPMTTKLPEADLENIYQDNASLEVFKEDKSSTWMEANCVHLWRETDTTAMDTSIDMGAPAGSTVYAPVTGEVVLVLDYDLYDEVPDVQIHIRPDNNPDLDVVLLHQTDVRVKAGDHVEAGVTSLSKVRDIAKDLTDVQLSFYTAGDDPGNHSHVQVNDLTNQDYLKEYFKGIELKGIDTSFPDESEPAEN